MEWLQFHYYGSLRAQQSSQEEPSAVQQDLLNISSLSDYDNMTILDTKQTRTRLSHRKLLQLIPFP